MLNITMKTRTIFLIYVSILCRFMRLSIIAVAIGVGCILGRLK